MTKFLQRVDVSLRSFYIFNSDFGQKEGEEHKKILYYHPNDIELNTKIKDVGLSEAIITFTGTFNMDDDCKALHTQKTTQIFHQPEPGYWMVLVLNVPKETKLKEGIEVTDYRGGDVSDRIYNAVLQQCYYMFRLFGGTFHMNMDRIGTSAGETMEATRQQLCEKLQLFYDKYLLAMKWPNCDIMEMMHSIQYLALDKGLFLRAHNFINMIRATFNVIDEAILLYNDQIVCSGQLSTDDLYSLHEYIVANVLDKARHTELSSGAVLTRNNSATAELYLNGAYITGPDTPTEQSQTASTKPPKVYFSLGDNASMKAYYLIIYRALNATLCLFIDAKTQPKQEFYDELHSYMGPQLTSLSRDIGEELAKQVPLPICTVASDCGGTTTEGATSMSPKYLFINEQSLKHHTNISSDRSRRIPTTANSIPRNVINLLSDLADSKSNNTTTEEIQVKTTNDFWIVKRRCNWRQYFVILYNSKATLLDVTQEAKRIFEQELTDDVFFDK